MKKPHYFELLREIKVSRVDTVRELLDIDRSDDDSSLVVRFNLNV